MEKISDVAVKLGYLDMPEGLLVDLKDLRLYNNDQITIVTTGSQGEPMSALTRIASSTHKNTPDHYMMTGRFLLHTHFSKLFSEFTVDNFYVGSLHSERA